MIHTEHLPLYRQADILNRRYGIEISRGTEHLKSMLIDFIGDLQCDGYRPYCTFNLLAEKKEPYTIYACRAHARRKFFDAKDDSPAAKRTGCFLEVLIQAGRVPLYTAFLKLAEKIKLTMPCVSQIELLISKQR